MRADSFSRRALLVSGLVLSLVACSGDSRPSILLVSVDTLRADHLGAYGFAADTSPNLDALAAGSAVFERAIAASGATVPSHATLMTSRWVRHHSVGAVNGKTRLAETERTLAALLAADGWDTAAFVSNVMLQRRIGLDTGFAVYNDALDDREANRGWAGERRAPNTTAKALAWLEEERGIPFLLWVHYNDPHGPYQPPAEHDTFSLSPEPDESSLPALEGQLGLRGVPAYQALDGLTRPSEYRSRYAGEIHAFDAELGRLIAAAERAAAPRALVVLLTADHGESMGENEVYFSHGHATTPDLAHVPFLLRAPGIEPARRRELVHHVDVLPTLLEVAGVSVPEDASGVALGPVLRGERELPERTLFCDIGFQASAYRGDRLLRANPGRAMGNVESGSWQAFRWLDGARFEPDADGAALRPALEAYLEDRPPLLRAQTLGPEKKELLRALGYLPMRPGQPR